MEYKGRRQNRAKGGGSRRRNTRFVPWGQNQHISTSSAQRGHVFAENVERGSDLFRVILIKPMRGLS